MFELGFWELVLIAIVGLVVLGPERLPKALASVGHWVRTIKQMANSAQQQVEHELNLQKLRDDLKKAEALGMHNLPSELQQSVASLQRAAAEVTRPYAITLPPATPAASLPADDTAPTAASEPQAGGSDERQQ
jgi:sec-independent protein translocase protein TatB